MTDVVKGDRELQRRFSAMTRRVQGNALRNAVRAGAIIVRDEARAIAPRDTGLMAKKIHIKVRRSRRGMSRMAVRTGTRTQMGMVADDFYYPGAVEFGTSEMNAQPFMRPAYDNKRGQAEATITSRIAAEIEKAASS